MPTAGAANPAMRKLLLEVEWDPQTDPAESERLSRQLLSEIRQLDIEAADPQASRNQPEGAKGNSLDWNALLITFGAAGGVFTALISLARAWLVQHSSGRRIKLTIDDDSIVLDGASAHEREALISAWMHRHSSE